MKSMKIAALLSFVLGIAGSNVFADDTAYFKLGPLAINVPFKTARIAYGHDFKTTEELIFGETPVISLWDKIEGTIGVVTSLSGRGSPTIGGDFMLGNILDKWITLPADLNIGGFGSRDFNQGQWMYGVKASIKLWG